MQSGENGCQRHDGVHGKRRAERYAVTLSICRMSPRSRSSLREIRSIYKYTRRQPDRSRTKVTAGCAKRRHSLTVSCVIA